MSAKILEFKKKTFDVIAFAKQKLKENGMCAKEGCKCNHLSWIGDGDRRLKCDVCGSLYVIVDGKPVLAEEK